MIGQAAKIAGTCGKAKASAPAKIVGTSNGHRRLRSMRPARTSGRVEVVRAAASRRPIGGVAPLSPPPALPARGGGGPPPPPPRAKDVGPPPPPPAPPTAAPPGGPRPGRDTP